LFSISTPYILVNTGAQYKQQTGNNRITVSHWGYLDYLLGKGCSTNYYTIHSEYDRGTLLRSCVVSGWLQL